jgi:cytochrome c oxidase subunit 3/cytochrome o ubiquinol oxidase subunit 3
LADIATPTTVTPSTIPTEPASQPDTTETIDLTTRPDIHGTRPTAGFTDHGGGHDGEHGHASSTGLSNNKLAMWMFLGSECLLFGGLISTYMLYRGRHEGSPSPSQLYNIPLTSISSFVLLMSSLTMVLAVSAAQRRDDRNTSTWLTVTALLGATFVGAQVIE